MNKSIEIRALESLVSELDKTIARLNKEILEKLEDASIERTRTSTLIEVLQRAFPQKARSIVADSVVKLRKEGDLECDLLAYYDASYEE
jgi:hypothetical protein